jgi:hypothetical protein
LIWNDGIFLVAGVFLNMATWYHPAYFIPVTGFLLLCLPVVLVMGLKRPWLTLWLVLLAFLLKILFPTMSSTNLLRV